MILMEELQEILNHLKTTLDKKQQDLFSLRSIQNFLLYYNQLTLFKPQVKTLLIEYFARMKQENYSIDWETCKIIGVKYIMGIGKYYGVELGFKIQTSLTGVFLWGLLADILLLMLGILHKVYYIPITTSILLINWGYRKMFYATKNKVFAIKY